MLWIVLIVLLAIAGGFLGTLLEFALWAVVLIVVLFAVVGLVVWRAVRTRSDARGRGTA